MQLELPPMNILADAALILTTAAHDAEDRANENALNKAMIQLHLGCQPVLTSGGVLIESRTRAGIVHRVSNLYGCNCEAGMKGRPCWHASTIEIVETAQKYTLTPTYKEAMEAIEELFV